MSVNVLEATEKKRLLETGAKECDPAEIRRKELAEEVRQWNAAQQEDEPINRASALCEMLEWYCANRDLDIKDVCNRCGISIASYYRWRKGENMSSTKLTKLANYLGLYVTLVPDRPGSPDSWKPTRESTVPRSDVRVLGGRTDSTVNLTRFEAARLVREITNRFGVEILTEHPDTKEIFSRYFRIQSP